MKRSSHVTGQRRIPRYTRAVTFRLRRLMALGAGAFALLAAWTAHSDPRPPEPATQDKEDVGAGGLPRVRRPAAGDPAKPHPGDQGRHGVVVLERKGQVLG